GDVDAAAPARREGREAAAAGAAVRGRLPRHGARALLRAAPGAGARGRVAPADPPARRGDVRARHRGEDLAAEADGTAPLPPRRALDRARRLGRARRGAARRLRTSAP